MVRSRISQKLLPELSRLYQDFLYDFPRVSRFYGGDWRSLETLVEAARRLEYPESRRQELVRALEDQQCAAGALERLARPGAVAVVTGQQVGLFSGPSYTIYKLLTTIKLAERLRQQGVEAVPVFWLASEDHDLAEAGRCWCFDENFRPVLLQVPAASSTPCPVGPLVPERYPIAELEASLDGFPYAGEVTALVQQAYAGPASMSEGFRRLLQALAGKWEVIFLDPLQVRVRELITPFLQDAARRIPELVDGLLSRSKELDQAGYHIQVKVGPSTSLFFLLEDGQRLALRRRSDGFHIGERRLDHEELVARAGQLSPNALLRPVVQDYLLPGVAYVGGPAEIAYMAQAEVLYRKLLGRVPVVFPRSSFTLIDARAAKWMDRYQLSLEECLHGLAPLRERIASRLIPADLEESFEQARQTIEEQLGQLRAKLLAFDRTLAAALDKSRAKILYQISKIHRKAAREALRRDERAAREAEILHHLVFPHKHLQERFYSLLPFLARHGLDVLEQLYASIDLECPDHLVVELGNSEVL